MQITQGQQTITCIDTATGKLKAITSDNVANLDGTAITGLNEGSGFVFLPMTKPDSVGNGVFTYSISSTYPFASYLYSVNEANGNSVSFGAYLEKGTYKLILMYRQYTTNGIVDVIVDGTTVKSIDMYGNSADIADLTTGINIATKGYKTITLTANGKNPSSSKYSMVFSGLFLIRTA